MAEGRRHTRVLPIFVDECRCRFVAADGHRVPTQLRIVPKKAHFVTPVTGQTPRGRRWRSREELKRTPKARQGHA